MYDMVKRIITTLIIISGGGLFFSQVKIDSTKEEVFIDYENDVKWISKVKSLNMGEVEYHNKNISVVESFKYINENSDIYINYNNVIGKYINKYMSYSWLPRIYGLLEFYEPLLEAKLKQYGLPLHLKYLVIVESNLNPQAGSWVGASGLWQFMPATGKNYGLAKNNKINLFYDPYLSTDSACRYLRYLYNMLKDWNLVLSAYNAGEGRVLGAIKKAGTKNYWIVRNYLPAETKAYAPSFHAVRYIGEAYYLYYKKKPVLKYNYAQVKEMKIKKRTSFIQFSRQYGLNLQTLYFLNPHIVTEEIPANSFVYYIKNEKLINKK